MTTSFVRETRFGILAAVPVERAPRDALLSALHPDEAALASTWGEPRVRTFAAGRRALREALGALASPAAARVLAGDTAILRDDRGAPILPAGVRASVSHKDDIAVALACSGDGFFLGVDVETLPGPREDVARHVLTPAERAELAPLTAEERRRALVLRFSLKEALYKALNPYVRRYVGFLEVEVRPSVDDAVFTLALKDGEGPFSTEAIHLAVEGAFITAVRVSQ